MLFDNCQIGSVMNSFQFNGVCIQCSSPFNSFAVFYPGSTTLLLFTGTGGDSSECLIISCMKVIILLKLNAGQSLTKL